MAEQDLSTDEVVDRIKAAFAPYRTEVDISDVGMKLEYVVYDEEQQRILTSGTTKVDTEYKRPSILEEALRDDRALLERKGYKFTKPSKPAK